MIRYTIAAERRRVRPHKSNKVMIIIYPLKNILLINDYCSGKKKINQVLIVKNCTTRCSVFEQLRSLHLEICTAAWYPVPIQG
jgi:hypothetical protein